MSESENLNFGPPSRHRPDTVEQVLQSLQPQPLEVSRDELFFQAGVAAGGHGSRAQYFWPSAVAALVLVCAGLGVALIWQAGAISTLQTAMAGAEQRQIVSTARNNSDAKPQADTERNGSDHFLVDERLRQWQRLASVAPFPPGRLTAMGWEESPKEMGSGDSESTRSTQPETAPHRPATYLELMRLQREG